MTAIIVNERAHDAAVAIAGAQFTVPLSADGLEPATHWGCNWVNCPETIASGLAGLAGVTLGESWGQTCASAGVQVIAPDAPAD